jgi:micrococcal nuclease
MSLSAIVLCLVVSISDGDTISVRCGDDSQVKVRLAEIDAPENSQAFGQRAKQAMSGMLFQKLVTLHPESTDRYGRLVAHVEVDGQDANFLLVAQGLAWCYDRYLRDAETCRSLQTKARQAKLGVWSEASPIPPWEFRKAKRQAQVAE